jgi:hypothetical protein
MTTRHKRILKENNQLYRVIQKSPYVTYGICVRRWLGRQFTGHWIGRRDPVEWPPRSPDLNPLVCNFGDM